MPRVDAAPCSDGQRAATTAATSSRPQHSAEATRINPATPFDFNPIASRSTRRRQLFGTLCERSAWIKALRTQTTVVRNATGSMICAWIANACYSLGNIFSGKPSVDQTRRELVVANAVWATITFCVVMLIARIPLMLPLRFLDAPDRPPTVWLCLRKLIRGTAFYFIVTMTVMYSCSSLIGYLTTIRPSIFRYKLDCYVGTLSTHGFFTGITLAAKRIYYRDTCQGGEHLLRAEQATYGANKRNPGGNTRVRPATALSFRAAYCKKSFMFWQAYIREFPKSAPAALAGAFVHVLSQQHIMESSGIVLSSFVAASVVFKLFIQESTKHYIIKKRIRSVRFMCAAVALPTVLIDTQTRIILLGTMNSKFVAVGTIGMAFVEILLRVGKAYLTMRTIHNREAQVPVHRQSVAATIRQHQPTTSLDANAPSPARIEFELWRRRVHAYHIAEINADTYAEYIAIGCSASILFFFGDHPYYSLLRHADNDEHKDQRWTNLKMLLFQAIIELVVDFVSTVLEMMAGIEFAIIKDLGAFFAVLFAITAVLNVNISMGTYLS